MGQNYKMIAKTFYGFEAILEKELKNLGAMNVEKGVRSVSFEGDKGFMYKANLCLRTALKILKPIISFRIRNEKDYYNEIYNYPWQEVFLPSQTFAIEVTLASETFKHSQYMAHRAKDAIVDKFRQLYNKRPNIDILHPDYQLHIHIDKNDQVHISLDSSGASLHHRGYRSATNIAPINEVLAAGILLLSGWQGQCDFLDPMCGSGTFLIEAAMIACNIPANLNRREFAFEKWKDYDVDLFEVIFDSSLAKSKEFYFQIIGYDKAPSAVEKAKENVKNARLSQYINVKNEDFFKTQKNSENKLHLVTNPPYGERLSIDVPSFYKNIGDVLKKNYPNTEAWLITSSEDAIKNIGLRPSRKIKLFNGKLESRLLNYSIYEGTKKIHKMK
ncbi:THUMP domain-containing class I SAM-dependent RNA methyltransferase [Capnocytophaga catalasegens]|uniref:RNA methyltransferase n=1 Tax=Capnocytophaga catalasegens TaxID=1004260 RepID=A0AAV5APD5_9FLAO|nr:class I SAM-dependent RNA methyltransferase [Capnocytophaga catalasegens]GIZ14079.1 RNA methyltransferase [Capnocytophaga catalasegens]GJM49077.1 RNA methyltransferase [Capnocytophaga catalasegens]GJM52338.1 RNA methyltransferase [Capnocytophaga catalasegens]